ncbi:hypothetical protein VTK73DRAFT_5570 [Phialemonium thermophilum]|uniref:Uncharacterized protein n=1 Tax=Phialemonium thermophilum TaxID=223376 RepID=A0ABR3XYC6_9PEZI
MAEASPAHGAEGLIRSADDNLQVDDNINEHDSAYNSYVQLPVAQTPDRCAPDDHFEAKAKPLFIQIGLLIVRIDTQRSICILSVLAEVEYPSLQVGHSKPLVSSIPLKESVTDISGFPWPSDMRFVPIGKNALTFPVSPADQQEERPPLPCFPGRILSRCESTR